MLTKDQVIERTKTLGASEIPAILGIDEHKTLFSVWHSKLYPNTEPAEDTAQQSRGHFAEPMIARMYQRDHQVDVHICQQLFRHPLHDWLTCTPDYGVGKPFASLLECKTAGHRWFDEDECPQDYEKQARTQSAITGLDVAVAAMNAHAFAEGTPFYWKVARDQEKERAILEAAEHFWFTYVVPKVEPPPDKSKEYADFCNVQPSLGKELLLTGDETEPELQEILVTMAEYRAVSQQIGKLEQDKDLLLNRARVVCRSYDVVKGPFGAFHYKQEADKEKTSWENACRYLATLKGLSEDEFQAIVRLNTRTIPGVRKPNPRWKK